MVNQWILTALTQCTPPLCTLCDQPRETALPLCPHCQASLQPVRHACPQCGNPLPATTPPGLRCGACLDTPPYFDRVIAPFHYQPPLSNLITAYKFKQRLVHARLFAALLTTAIRRTHSVLPEIIVPVPLHPTRQRERGYNQALEIARLLGKQLNIAVDKKCIQRIRATQPQSDLDAHDRSRNVRGAFVLRDALPYQHIALVDDVLTTGSTVNEIARLIKKNANVKTVEVWCIAHAGG